MKLEDRVQGLLGLVRDYEARECREILAGAQAEVRRLLAETYRRERARLHERVVSERANARSRILAVRAERDTRIRSSSERANARLLELAWPRLRTQLQSRWSAPQTRRVWIGTALSQALAVLPSGRWTVRHPPDWPATERAELRARLESVLGQAPSFLSDGGLIWGLIIEAEGALLDASLDGLLRDRGRIEARLLALLAVEASRAIGTTP